MSQKIGIIIYHSNLLSIYQQNWIDKCVDSIMHQTMGDFHVYELCYSEERYQIWSGFNYVHKPMTNHIHAMNYVLDWAFQEGCGAVFNVNLDDYYAPMRFEKQLKAIRDGADLVSSNFQNVEEVNGEDVLGQVFDFAKHDIIAEFNKGHNVVSHPCCCYSRRFWEKNKYYDVDRLGDEDFQLWKKAVSNGSKIVILDDILHYYRQSPKQTGRVNQVK